MVAVTRPKLCIRSRHGHLDLLDRPKTPLVRLY